jgi:hypothetical protein
MERVRESNPRYQLGKWQMEINSARQNHGINRKKGALLTKNWL